jgi:polysaccharide biosynthesis transport protein
MDLKDYYRLVLRNLRVVIVCTLLGILAAAGITYSQTPIYQADVQLFVSTPSSALDIGALAQGSSFSQQRVISYAQVINGPGTLNPIIQALHLPYTETQLAKQVKATAPLNTVLIDVTVSDPNAQRAADIANAIGNQFSSTALGLESSSGNSTVKVSMVKSAIKPLNLLPQRRL